MPDADRTSEVENPADDGRFWVKSLTLENFRCFEKLELTNLDPQFNLLIGENGTGKSSVLVALANLFRQLGTPGANPGEPMTNPSDIRSVNRVGVDGVYYQQSSFSGRLLAELQFEGRNWSAIEPVGTGVPYNSGAYPQPGVYGEIIRDPAKPHDVFRPGIDTRGQISDVPLPFIANYSVSRKFRRTVDRENFNTRLRYSRLSGLSDWRDAGVDVRELSEWFKDQTLLDLQQRNLSKDADDQLGRNQVLSQIVVAQDAIATAIEDIKSIEYEAIRNDIVIQFREGNRRDFGSMSDGQRSLIGLIADITHRVCLLNAPVLGRRVLSETPGLVLIDEIDLHLHPKWQRHIVGALKKIFPKIQFFATTHSPQVIGEARPEEIVLLTKDGKQKRPPQSFGMDSKWILECVMEAEGRNPMIARRIKSLFELIEADSFDQAKAEIASLREIIDGDPEVVAAESYLWNLEPATDEAAE